MPLLTAKRSLLLLLATTITFLLPFLLGYNFTTLHSRTRQYLHLFPKSQTLHLLLPATDPNAHLCKLLLSAALTGYPDPVLIGWRGHGLFNGAETHLFKITETLAYLRSLPPRMNGDMVLLLDAYDIWMQLRVEVMLSRYSAVVEKQNARLRADGILGKWHAGGEVRQSIVVGADRLCWPQLMEDPSCWAVPESDLPEKAFGPKTDTDMWTNRPRWVNSGTVVGPVKEMRELFAATLDMVSLKYDPEWERRTSDQFYFAEVYTEQEVNRRKLRDGDSLAPHILEDGTEVAYPGIAAEKRTEYHITMDYGTDMFQTLSAFDPFLTWMTYNHSTTPASDLSTKRLDALTLPNDILASPPPFAAASSDPTFPTDKSWTTLPLGTNAITQTVFPLLHMTGDKSARERWWPRMWFHPHSEELLRAERRLRGERKHRQVFAVVEGVEWREPERPVDVGKEEEGMGGAWSDRGEWLSWREMCGEFEDVLWNFTTH